MSKVKCACSNLVYIDPEAYGHPQETGFCIADKCILNEPKYITQAEAEKIGAEMWDKWKSKGLFTPSMVVLFILRKFNIHRKEGDLD